MFAIVLHFRSRQTGRINLQPALPFDKFPQRGASACIQRNRYANGTPQGLRSSGKLGHRHLLDRAISTAAPTHTSSTLASISTCGSPSVAAPVIDLSRRFSGLESSSGFKFAQPGSLAKERVANGPPEPRLTEPDRSISLHSFFQHIRGLSPTSQFSPSGGAE